MEKETMKLTFDKSETYRKKIHKLIPGGAHTYSKGDDTFPLTSPAAIDRGKGSYVWDIDGNKFLDCAMGLTSVTLGHSIDELNEAIIEEIQKGVNFQRPSYLEADLAELFLSLIRQHDRIKFAKNGSTVTTAAIKLARAFTGRKLVAFPEDQPFFSYDDWFIGKTKTSFGVPEEYSTLSKTFKSCNLNSLRELFETYPNQIAAVIFEPRRTKCESDCSCTISNEAYLNEASKIIHSNGSILILDEMITGFKAAFPGLTTKLNIDADITTWGKSISNGFSFAAMTGKSKIMDLGGITNEGSKKVFLTSTTHGAETIGIRAVIETINFYKKNNVIQHIHDIGKSLYENCISILKDENFTEYLNIIPNYWMLIFELKHSKKDLIPHLQTSFSQQMILNGILIQAAFVPSYSHGKDEIDLFCKAFRKTIQVIKLQLTNIDELKKVKPTKKVFRKYI